MLFFDGARSADQSAIRQLILRPHCANLAEAFGHHIFDVDEREGDKHWEMNREGGAGRGAPPNQQSASSFFDHTAPI